jgi:hypothetical protein
MLVAAECFCRLFLILVEMHFTGQHRTAPSACLVPDGCCFQREVTLDIIPGCIH